MTCRVIVFGTGRCGSTYIQRLISAHSSTWIWGEHGGVLGPLITTVRAFENSQLLRDNVFNWYEGATDEFLVDQVTHGASSLSWLNRLSHDTLRKETAALFERLFGDNVPAGWNSWGFKEILYGLNNDIPDILLDIFPEARGAFCFREPRTTLESMVRTWSPGLFRAEAKPAQIKSLVRERSSRIRTLMNYYLDLRLRRGRPILFLSEQMYKLDPAIVLKLFGLEARPVPASENLRETNKGPKRISSAVTLALTEEWSEVGAELTALYGRALALSEADIASVTESELELFPASVPE